MTSHVRRVRDEREQYVAAQFTASNLERKIRQCFNPDNLTAGQAILARLDEMPAVTDIAEQRAGLIVGAKLRALYLSGGDLESLERAVGLALADHRDLHMISETPARYAPEWTRTSELPRTDPDGRAAFDELVEWLAS